MALHRSVSVGIAVGCSLCAVLSCSSDNNGTESLPPQQDGSLDSWSSDASGQQDGSDQEDTLEDQSTKDQTTTQPEAGSEAGKDAPVPPPPDGGCVVDEHCTEPSKPLCQQGACVACSTGNNDAKFVDEDVKDGTKLTVGQAFVKRWKLSNSGQSAWSTACGFSFEHQSGPLLGTVDKAQLPSPYSVAPSDEYDWKIDMVVPSTPGSYKSYWQMKRSGTFFGEKVWVDIVAVPCTTDTDCKTPGATTCSNGHCVAPPCTADSECTDPAKPFCVGSCVQCKTGADCPSDKPNCNNGSCQAPSLCGDGPKPTQYVWPVPDKHAVCQGFKNPIEYQTCKFHTGIDVCGTEGMALLAIADGKVVYVGPLWIDGVGVGRGPYAIVVQHSTNFYSTISHNKSALVQAGDCVTMGQVIAEMGNLGYSGGPHLHFEIVEGTPFTGDWQTPFADSCSHYVDPLDYITP